MAIAPERELVLQAVRELARERVAPRAAQIDESAEFPWDMVELFRENDLFGLPFDEEHGGTGTGALVLLRAVLVGALFGFVLQYCRSRGADLRRAAGLALAAFVVSAVALGLRPQLFGMVLLAFVLLLLAERRRHPRAAAEPDRAFAQPENQSVGWAKRPKRSGGRLAHQSISLVERLWWARPLRLRFAALAHPTIATPPRPPAVRRIAPGICCVS